MFDVLHVQGVEFTLLANRYRNVDTVSCTNVTIACGIYESGLPFLR